MKNTIILATAILLSGVSFAQEVISTQGSSYTSVNASMDFTIGEVIIDTGSDGTVVITQGFHQTTWSVTAIDDHSINVEISVFPNPLQDQLTIQSDKYAGVSYQLFDSKGKLIATDVLTSNITQIEVSQLTTGAYFLQITNIEGRSLKTFNLIKSK